MIGSYTSKGPLLSHRLVSEIHKALVDHGIKRNAEKDVTGAANGTALGLDLVYIYITCYQKVGDSAFLASP